MGLFDRCRDCGAFLIFRGRRPGNICPTCEALRQKKERERKKRHARTLERKRAQRERYRREQEEALREEVHRQHEPQHHNAPRMASRLPRTRAPTRGATSDTAQKAREKKPKTTRMKRPRPAEDEALLYVFASVKRLLVEEYMHGKKRVCLNKEREVRRTQAGGFSAEKFQRFVDAKRAHTFEWIQELLSKPGVLKGPYDRIVVQSPDESLKESIEDYLDSR